MSQLILIGWLLACLEVTFSRTVLIGDVDHVTYRGMMESGTTAHCKALQGGFCGLGLTERSLTVALNVVFCDRFFLR